jgi:hypothetical protein
MTTALRVRDPIGGGSMLFESFSSGLNRRAQDSCCLAEKSDGSVTERTWITTAIQRGRCSLLQSPSPLCSEGTTAALSDSAHAASAPKDPGRPPPGPVAGVPGRRRRCPLHLDNRAFPWPPNVDIFGVLVSAWLATTSLVTVFRHWSYPVTDRFSHPQDERLPPKVNSPSKTAQWWPRTRSWTPR